MNHASPKDMPNQKACQMCGISAKKSSLHKISAANSSSAKDIVLCQACIPIHFLSLLSMRESERASVDVEYETELQRSRKKEPRARRAIYQKLSESDDARLEEHDLTNSVAEEIGISPTTVTRYINKMCSSSGVLRRSYDDNDTYIEFNLKKVDFQ